MVNYKWLMGETMTLSTLVKSYCHPDTDVRDLINCCTHPARADKNSTLMTLMLLINTDLYADAMSLTCAFTVKLYCHPDTK